MKLRMDSSRFRGQALKEGARPESTGQEHGSDSLSEERRVFAPTNQSQSALPSGWDAAPSPRKLSSPTPEGPAEHKPNI